MAEMIMMAFGWVLERSMLVLPVILFLLVVRIGLRRVSSLLMYLLWLVVWVRLVCPVSIDLPVGLTSWTDRAMQSVYERVDSAHSDSISLRRLVANQKSNDSKTFQEENQRKETAVSTGQNSSVALSSEKMGQNQRTEISSREIFCIVWVVGFVLIAGYQCFISIRLHRKIRVAVRKEKGVYLCESIPSAFVKGIFHAQIYIPFGMDKEAQKYILAHERAHIWRKDYLIKKLCFMICLIYWFHPLVWLAYICMCNDMELSCDDMLLRKMDGNERKKYSYVLLSSAIGKREHFPMYQTGFGKNSLKYRIQHTLLYQNVKTGVLLVAIFVAIFAGVMCMTDYRESSVFQMKPGGSYSKQVQKLYSIKAEGTPNLDDMDNLLQKIISEGFGEFDINRTDTILHVKFRRLQVAPDSVRRKIGDYSAVILSLVPNVSTVQWQYEEIQEGGSQKTINLQYDWNTIQREDFIDASVSKLARTVSSENLGASASSFQQLVNALTYCDFGKTNEKKKAQIEVDTEQIKQMLQELPVTYDEAAKLDYIYIPEQNYHEDTEEQRLYNRYENNEIANKEDTESLDDSVSGESKDVHRKEEHKEIWTDFYQKVKKGETASMIKAWHVYFAAPAKQKGSVSYTYCIYDGAKYTVVNRDVSKYGEDDFFTFTGKYLLEDINEGSEQKTKEYYVADDCSVSYQDWFFSGLYAGMDGGDPLDFIEISPLVSKFIK